MQNCSVQNSVADGMDVDMLELVVQNSASRTTASEGIFVGNEAADDDGNVPHATY